MSSKLIHILKLPFIDFVEVRVDRGNVGKVGIITGDLIVMGIHIGNEKERN